MPRDRRLVLVLLVAGLAAVLLVGHALGPSLAHGPGSDTASAPPPLSLQRTTDGESTRSVLVHVVGAVHHPGVYRLRGGSRVRDAVRLAGGARAGARLQEINLAERLADGEQVVVPGRGVRVPAAQPGAAGGVVHLSSATVEQLDALDGIGPALAQRIV